MIGLIRSTTRATPGFPGAPLTQITDGTPPVISSVVATPAFVAGVITWLTDEFADAQVEYGPTVAYGSSTAIDSTFTLSHSVTITNLAAGATYHYRVKSRDVIGNLATGSDGTFTTAAAAPTPRMAVRPATRTTPTFTFAPVLLDLIAPTLTVPVGTKTGQTTATVGATTNEVDGTLYVVVTTSNTTPSKAQVKTGKDAAGATAAYASSQPITTSGAKTFSATALALGTTYYAHLMHEDAAGNQSNVVTSAPFTTDPNAVPNTPTITAGTPSTTSVTLTSSAFSDPDVGDTHAASQWQVTALADTGYATPVVSTGDDATNLTAYTATGLLPATPYRARVRHRDSAGNYSAYSTSDTFSTAVVPDTTPPTVVGNPFVDTAGTTLTVTFSEGVAGVVANQYTLKTGHTLSGATGNQAGGLFGDVWTYTVSAAVENGETLSLDYAGTSTLDSGNNPLATFVDRAVTNNVPLGTPSINLDATGPSTLSTDVGWFMVAGATGYKVQRSLDGVTWGTPVTLGNVLSYSDTTTTAGITYYYRVAARNAGGDGPYSTPTDALVALGPIVSGGTGLTAPILSHPSSTASSIILIWSPSEEGQGTVTYKVYRDGDLYASAATSPFDATSDLEQLTLYSWTVTATDDVTTTTSNAVIGALEYDGASVPSSATGAIQVYTNIDVFRADAWVSSEGVGRTLSVTYDNEPWPDTLSSAHFYAEPTEQTLDDYPSAASLDAVSCTVDVPTGSGRKVTINLTGTELGTLQASLRGTAGYRWWLIANKDSNPATLRAGTMTVRPNPTAV
jgi:hypothetical protein